MPSKLQAIRFGSEIVQSGLACSDESTLDSINKENQKQIIRSYTILFLVQDLFRDFEKLIELNMSDHFLVELVKLIQSIRPRLIVALAYVYMEDGTFVNAD